MNNRFFFIIAWCTLSACGPSVTQHRWKGMTSQDDNHGISSFYATELTFTQTADSVRGIGHYRSVLDSTMYVYYHFIGAWQGDTLFLLENGIQEASEISGEWLMKDVRLYYTGADQASVAGKWAAQKYRYMHGKMELTVAVP